MTRQITIDSFSSYSGSDDKNIVIEHQGVNGVPSWRLVVAREYAYDLVKELLVGLEEQEVAS